jgi:hypothetical protein
VWFCEKWAELDGFFFTADGEMRGKRGLQTALFGCLKLMQAV